MHLHAKQSMNVGDAVTCSEHNWVQQPTDGFVAAVYATFQHDTNFLKVCDGIIGVPVQVRMSDTNLNFYVHAVVLLYETRRSAANIALKCC